MSVELSSDGKAVYNVNRVERESVLSYGCALLVIAGADGEVSPPEWEWLDAHARRYGVPDDVVAEWRAYDFAGGALEELIPKIGADLPINIPRTLIYDAIRMAWADNEFAALERAAVERAARLLDVSPHDRRAIGALIQLEVAVERMRQGLLETAGNEAQLTSSQG